MKDESLEQQHSVVHSGASPYLKTVHSNLAKGRIAVLSRLAVTNAFVCPVCWAGTFAAAACEQCTHVTYVRMDRHMHMFPSKSPLLVGGYEPHRVHGSLDPHNSASPYSISIGSAVFVAAQLSRVPNTQTHRPRYVRHL